MTKLNDYLITEGRGKEMKKDDAWNWIWMNCKKLMKWMGTGSRDFDGRFIARSVGGYERKGISYVFIEPKKAATPRVSRNTKNYYTLIMDNEASWKKFPKRSESIICLTDGYDYGSNEYIIFPKDGWKVGNTNERDFWGVVDNIDTRLDNMSDWAEMINVLLNFDNEDRKNRYDKTLQQFKKRCEEFDNYIDTHGKEEIVNILYDGWHYNDMYKLFTETYKGDLYRLLLSHIQPSRLGITLNKVGDNLPKETEIWTDSPCVMIQSFEWKTHRKEILGRGK
jgi:hypothetical protein